jgi:CreA protein
MAEMRVLYPAVAGVLLMLVTGFFLTGTARADDLACVSTTFRFVGANDKVCVSAFDDPKVPGVACDISQARKGGVKGTLGLAEDPSRFSLACRQVGPISADLSQLPRRRVSLLRAHLDLLQAHPRLSHRRQEAEHARVPRDQRQDRQRLAAEFSLKRTCDALGSLMRRARSGHHKRRSTRLTPLRRAQDGILFPFGVLCHGSAARMTLIEGYQGYPGYNQAFWDLEW